MDLPELVVGGILLVPIIVALVELAKSVGLPTQYAPWLNGVLSLAAYGLVVLVAQVPDALEPVTYGLNALIIFLSAAGFYDRAQAILKK